MATLNMAEPAFRPWRAQMLRGYSFIAMAGATVFLGAIYMPVAALAAFPLYLVGMLQVSQAKSRRFGQRFEVETIARGRSIAASRNWSVQSNLLVRGVGDIDLVFRKGRCVVPVEIKSYSVLDGKRIQALCVQIERQKKALGTPFAIVWLAQSRRGIVEPLPGIRGVLVAHGVDALPIALSHIDAMAGGR